MKVLGLNFFFHQLYRYNQLVDQHAEENTIQWIEAEN